MTETAEKLKSQIAALSSEDREELLEFLEESLYNGTPIAGDEAAFDAELARRVGRIKSGQAIGIPAEQVFEELRKKYG